MEAINHTEAEDRGMFFEWDVELIGEAEMLLGFDRLYDRMGDFSKPLRKSAERAAQFIGENIVRGGLPNPFAPLAYTTIKGTTNRLGGPLYRYGHLLEVATDTTGSMEGSAFEVKPNEAKAGFKDDTPIGRIANILTEGSEKTNLPPRQFVYVLDSDVEAMVGYFAEDLDDALAKSFSTRLF
jgi:hypothetical protein